MCEAAYVAAYVVWYIWLPSDCLSDKAWHFSVFGVSKPNFSEKNMASKLPSMSPAGCDLKYFLVMMGSSERIFVTQGLAVLAPHLWMCGTCKFN